MNRRLRTAPAAALLGLLSLFVGLGDAPPLAAQEARDTRDGAAERARMENRYVRAERLLRWHQEDLVPGDQITPSWLPGGHRFWYRSDTGDGHAFVYVDPATRTRRPLFDHVRLAGAMSETADTAFVHTKLPFQTVDVEMSGDAVSAVEFDAAGRSWRCALPAHDCEILGDAPPPGSDAAFVTSPDGAWEAFVHEHDLWIRPAGEAQERDSVRLTDDGEEFFSYGVGAPGPSQIRNGSSPTPALRWSPDSRRIAVAKIDERSVAKFPLYSSTSQRPEWYLYPYAIPGDSVRSMMGIHVVDVETRSKVELDAPTQGAIGMAQDSVWSMVKWKEGGETLYFTHETRGSKKITLYEADPSSGTTRVVLADSMPTHIQLNLAQVFEPPNWDVINGGEDVIWFSERDGWGHLYRFDRDGNLKNQITEGDWTVGTIKYIDESQGRIYFTARSTGDAPVPSMAQLYAVNLDGSGLTRLDDEPMDHTVQATPDGRWFVDQYSTPWDPPVAVVRDRTGAVTMELERADATRLAEETGWSAPELVTFKARDGVTDLHGLLYKPSDFDPTKTYPVVQHIYPGPFIAAMGLWSWDGGSLGAALRVDQRAMAELGFVVVQLEHLGIPFRSKAVQDGYWGFMGDNGLPDHITGIKQLAAERPWMDVTRVGIYGHSGGGFASTDAILRYPDFYKVAVSTAGNHDNRSYNTWFAERYHGLLERDTLRGTDNFERSANQTMAENLEGKLLLAHGDLDDNVHPAMTLKVVDALIDANKSFDLIILPDRGHGLAEPYMIRRRWDYFVEHLMGTEPPMDYEIAAPPAN